MNDQIRIVRMIVYKKTDEWYIEWQRMTTSGTTNDNEWYNEWKRVTTSGTSDNKWYRKWTRMTTSNKKWQRMTASDKRMNTNESRYNRAILWFKRNKRPIWFLNNFIQFYMQYSSQMFLEIRVLKVCNIHSKTPVLESLFNKDASLKACNFTK